MRFIFFPGIIGLRDSTSVFTFYVDSIDRKPFSTRSRTKLNRCTYFQPADSFSLLYGLTIDVLTRWEEKCKRYYTNLKSVKFYVRFRSKTWKRVFSL